MAWAASMTVVASADASDGRGDGSDVVREVRSGRRARRAILHMSTTWSRATVVGTLACLQYSCTSRNYMRPAGTPDVVAILRIEPTFTCM